MQYIQYLYRYGSKEYDLGFGRQPFYDNLCAETRCVATDNR